MNKKLTKNDKRILKEDIQDLKWLAEKYKAEGKLAKAADCEKEIDDIKKKLKGDEDGIC
ncbi:MAG: hypothetical protein ACI3T9_01180 [Romboutsia timonensis]